MSKLLKGMAHGTAEAGFYMEGKRKGYKITLAETVDMRGLRKRPRLSKRLDDKPIIRSRVVQAFNDGR